MRNTGLFAAIAASILILSSCSAEREVVIPLAVAVEVQYDTAVVVRKDISQKRQYEAYIKATIETAAFDRSGTLKTIHVALGDKVKKGDPLAEIDVSAIEAQITSARNDLDYKRRKYQYDLEQKQYDIAIAQIDLDALISRKAAKLDIELAETQRDKLKTEAEYIKRNAEIDIRQAEKRLAELESSLIGSVITAPCDGEIVSVNALTQGDRVAAHLPIIYIADNSRLYVQYDGTDSIGSSARTAAMSGGVEYALLKEEYDPQEYLALILSGRKPPARFHFVEENINVRAGDFVALTVYINEKENVLQVPVNSLYYNAGTNYVYRMENGKKIYTVVGVGMRTDSAVEITDGLEEGDVVFVKQ